MSLRDHQRGHELPRKKEKGSPGGWRSLLETHQVLEGGFHSLWSVASLLPRRQSVKQLHKISLI